MIQDNIPKLVDEQTNRMISRIPSEEEIHSTVMNLKSDSSSVPDWFGALFYQKYWDIR